MTRFASASSVIALFAAGFAGAPLAAQAARDFQLPPATASPDNRVQGPVDTDAPVPVRPRAIETARPTPAPAPTPAPTTATNVAPAPAQPPPVPARTAAPPPNAAARVVPETPATNAPDAAALPSTAPPPAAQPLPGAATAPVALPPAIPSAASPAQAPLPWLWIALAGLAIAAAAFAVARYLRRPRAAPTILTPAASAAAPGNSAEGLALSVEAIRLDRSVMNATVGYRVTLRNRTTQALTGVAVEADLVSASRERPAEAQLASPDQALALLHTAERIAPGQSLRFEGQVRLPLSQASAIWQGRVGLLVPLLRVRATAAEALPVATTLVIGRAEGSTSRPQPFRLDEPPRSYAPVAQRTLDAVPISA